MDLPVDSHTIKQARTNPWLIKYLVAALSCGYLLSLTALVFYIRTCGDRTLLATLLLFSPQWVWLLPLVFLVPLSTAFQKRMLPVLLVSLAIAIFPLMGFNFGWHRFYKTDPTGMPLRVMAFNVHQNNLMDPAFARYLQDQHPDIVGLEEAPADLNPALFPTNTWNRARDGEQLIASRYPIISKNDILGGTGTVCTLKTPRGLVKIIIVHLASPHVALRDSIINLPNGGSPELRRNIAQRTQQTSLLNKIIADTTIPLIIAGDLNLPPNSPLFRAGFSSLTDSFQATEFGFGWTYRNDWTVVRIDHILTSNDFDPKRFSIGPRLGSPHRPIIADLVLKPH